MYQALYRKWRPQTFSDVVGQEHITSVLQFQVEQKRVSHAYLFCGSRGTGKTTCAKLLAKAVNCLNPENGNPCNKCEACVSINSATSLDVVELDAASNNKVDDIRRLCDEVVYPPSSLKKRVYIVDEVHMLTIQAFNALLKTIEEPPEHAVFILATTELQKVPATIVSRCQRFDFSRIRKEKIVDRIMMICSSEGINIDREAAFVLAGLSDGAMRDALSLLESCASKGAFITTEYVINLLGLSNREQLIELIYSCAKQNTSRALLLLEQLYASNGDLTTCFTEMLDICRDLLIIHNVSSPSMYINASEEEMKKLSDTADNVTHETLNYFIGEIERFISDIPTFGMNKKAAAEIAVIRMTTPAATDSVEALRARISQLEKALSDPDAPKPCVPIEKKPPQKAKVEKPRKEADAPAPKSGNKEIFEHVNEFVRRFGERETMIDFFMKGAVIKKDGECLKIYCPGFNASMIDKPDKVAVALEIARELDPDILRIEVIPDDGVGAESGKDCKNDDLSQFEN